MRHHPDCVFNWSGESETCNCTELYKRDEAKRYEDELFLLVLPRQGLPRVHKQ